jgi:ABC-type Fe3+ transport system substrate-binding protein
MTIAFTIFILLWSWLPGFAASGNSALLKARQEAESKGYVFFTNRDEILSKAKREGKLRVQASLGPELKATTEAFRKKYPFIDLDIEMLKGGEDVQRFLLQIRAGAAKDWDITRAPTDFYSEVLAHLWKVDLLGMAQHGVLDIPPKMIDPKNRNVIAFSSIFGIVGYNKNLISPSQLPKTWEHLLKPEFKGRKFATEIRPQNMAALVPAWGLEKTLVFAQRIAAQEPIWARGASRMVSALAAGEVPMIVANNFATTKSAQLRDPTGAIGIAILEPVPVRSGAEQGILATARNPNAALLWLEFMGGPEAQKLIDQNYMGRASLYSNDSVAEQELRGKQLSVISWEDGAKLEPWIAKITEAYGFPNVEKK